MYKMEYKNTLHTYKIKYIAGKNVYISKKRLNKGNALNVPLELCKVTCSDIVWQRIPLLG